METYLFHCERIFVDLGLNDEQKMRLAFRQLHGAALYWWNSVTVTVNEETITWTEFRRRFNKRFMSEIAKSTLLKKFAEFAQRERWSVLPDLRSYRDTDMLRLIIKGMRSLSAN